MPVRQALILSRLCSSSTRFAFPYRFSQWSFHNLFQYFVYLTYFGKKTVVVVVILHYWMFGKDRTTKRIKWGTKTSLKKNKAKDTAKQETRQEQALRQCYDKNRDKRGIRIEPPLRGADDLSFHYSILHFSIGGLRLRGRCRRHRHSGIRYLSSVPELSGIGFRPQNSATELVPDGIGIFGIPVRE